MVHFVLPQQLTCVPLEPGFPSADWVRWLHNGRRLLKGRKGSFVLAVDRATAADAGNYTCIPHSSQVCPQRSTELTHTGSRV